MFLSIHISTPCKSWRKITYWPTNRSSTNQCTLKEDKQLWLGFPTLHFQSLSTCHSPTESMRLNRSGFIVQQLTSLIRTHSQPRDWLLRLRFIVVFLDRARWISPPLSMLFLPLQFLPSLIHLIMLFNLPADETLQNNTCIITFERFHV